MAHALTYAHPSDLHIWWHLVRPGLEILAGKASDGWIPEDIYAALKAGGSFLHICTDDGAFAGFVVLTPIQGFKEKRCHIWAAYSTNPKSDAVEAYLGDIERVGEQMGARKITFSSPRRWDRRLEKYGYKATVTTYEKDMRWTAADQAR